MQNNDNYQAGGVGFCGWIAILFIGLKLAGFIEWSWVWVLSPLWIPFALCIVIFLIIVAFEIFS